MPIDLPKSPIRTVIPALRSQIIQRVAEQMHQCDVEMSDLNTPVRKVLLHHVKFFCNLNKHPGVKCEERRVREICWRIFEIHNKTNLSIDEIVASMPQKQRGRPSATHSAAKVQKLSVPCTCLSSNHPWHCAQHMYEELREAVGTIHAEKGKSTLSSLYYEKITAPRSKSPEALRSSIKQEAIAFLTPSEFSLARWQEKIFEDIQAGLFDEEVSAALERVKTLSGPSLAGVQQPAQLLPAGWLRMHLRRTGPSELILRGGVLSKSLLTTNH